MSFPLYLLFQILGAWFLLLCGFGLFQKGILIHHQHSLTTLEASIQALQSKVIALNEDWKVKKANNLPDELTQLKHQVSIVKARLYS